MEDDISIVLYRIVVFGNLQFELKSILILEIFGFILILEEEIMLFVSFYILRIIVNVKFQVLLFVFRNLIFMKFVSGLVVDLLEGVKLKLLMEGLGFRFIVSFLIVYLFSLI